MPLSFDKIRELRSQRAKLAHDAQQIISRAEKANRAMSAEEEQRFDLLMKESDLLKETITREERLLELDAELTERTEIRSGI